MNTPLNINQISNLPAPRSIGHGGKNRAIPSWGLALESTPSGSTLGLTPTLRRVTLTNLIAGPLWPINRVSRPEIGLFGDPNIYMDFNDLIETTREEFELKWNEVTAIGTQNS